MSTQKLRLLASLMAYFILLPGIGNANPIVFDGGGPNGNTNLIVDAELNAYLVADDFRLGKNSILTDVHFWTLEPNVTRDDLKYWIFSDNHGSPSTVLASGVAEGVTRTPTGISHNYATVQYIEYTYSFDIDALALAADTQYWLGLYLPCPTGQIFWESTSLGIGSHSISSTDGGQNFNPSYPGFYTNRAFYLTGLDDPVIPEPSTLLLICFGLAGLLVFRRKFRRA